ncbi:MAG: gamma-glutamyltransferase [Gammaproteobacteria bacterium]|nr:gamma-glutamyltransferase [Gammaproteobacteria bacterium]
MSETNNSTSNQFYEHWTITKPAIHSTKGLVASQHYLASKVGVEVLQNGGNAVDAAVATGLALGTVEPAMSGIGGGGFMTVYSRKLDQVQVVEFGMRAPFAAQHSDYPLTGNVTGASSFNWPEVENDRNVHGPLSIAVPGYVKGVSLALERFGTWKWNDVIQPACSLAKKGLPTNWYMVHYITKSARLMRKYEEINRVYLGDGLPPETENEDTYQNHIPLGNLAETYRTLKEDGPDSFYFGTIARKVVADLNHAGSKITTNDLSDYRAYVTDPLRYDYRENEIYTPTRRSAGPTLARTLAELQKKKSTTKTTEPTALDYRLYTETLLEAYQYRLSNLGDGAIEEPGSGATSHICVADKDGNLVSLTQTLMSSFGSYVMLPQTGILMNNGMMWFDPRPSRANSVEGGRYPLSNMCPTIGRTIDGRMFALGACGGRQIFPAVYQIVSFLCDFGMDVNDAVHQARVDVSGTDLVTIMDHLNDEAINHLREHFANTQVRKNGMSPVLFGVPQVIERDRKGQLSGGCMIPSPMAAVHSI